MARPFFRCATGVNVPAVDAVGLVVNVGTDRIATLAVASILTHSKLPVILIDCGTDQPAEQRFRHLLARWPGRVTVRTEPVLVHGVLLDRVLPTVNADIVFCVDSDTELLTDSLVPSMLETFDHDDVFGAGFINRACWIGPVDGVKDGVAYYQERLWMPFVAVRTKHVMAALAAGMSFEASTWWNDFPASQTISRQLAKRFQDGLSPAANMLWKLRPLRGHFGWRLPWLAWIRRDFNGHRPNYVYYDTGANVYQWCKHTANLLYAGTDCAFAAPHVHHVQGVTRHALTGTAVNGTAYHDVAADVEVRLATYGL